MLIIPMDESGVLNENKHAMFNRFNQNIYCGINYGLNYYGFNYLNPYKSNHVTKGLNIGIHSPEISY